ncbi:betaine/proline/choline family ABC transporter ATP-binding protein [Paenalcaligenes niemegkensis]|uniref:betaine/proline/choline family ABC transporter ATP-binding protein n=1 Tax=Paenalcaligenes niemegkensis TaxID=2895469 RepID=UPI001EE7E094|nr:betaine/proline/choline family ABC transporter ATP-binding protein [Paenalcaligenes niemegkensis]MCQ9617807.1 betaine/proline/choline family ABC transporter ATP-binding protein [Paenalcaligenes niemegkensis]
MTQSKVQLRNIIKVFGAHPDKAVALLEQGMPKQEAQKASGSNIGLAGVSAEFKAGEISCIMGLSGSGKSTLIRHINRLIDPTSGELMVDGENILDLSLDQLREFRRRKMSMVFQSFALLPHLTVHENVAFGLMVRHDDAKQAAAQASLWIENVGLVGYEHQYPDELSGGMRQRVGLARALATDAEILLMDEAFSALDPLIRYEMQDQLLSLQSNLQKTVIFVTHDIDEALRLGQHIVILRDGLVEQAGSPAQIVENPNNEYVEHFIARRQR